MNENIITAMNDFLKTELFIDNIGNDDELIHSGILDSMQLLQLVLFLEEAFGTNFPPDIFSDTNNFSSLAKIANSAVKFINS